MRKVLQALTLSATTGDFRKPQRILRNSVRCEKCNTEIESKHRHDFVTCPCGQISVDGGHSYLRRAFKGEQWHDTSHVEMVDRNVKDEGR